MSSACASLRKEGKCPGQQTGACSHDHFLKLCCVCKVILDSRSTFRGHYQSHGHVLRCFTLGIGDDGYCKVCDISYCEGTSSQTLAAYVQHCASEGHLNNREDRPNVILPAKDVPLTPTGRKYCRKCEMVIPKRNWETHSVGPPHMRAEEFYIIRDKLEHEPPRNLDVTIDYGDVNPKKTTSLHAIHLHLTVPGRIRLTDFRMESASGGHIFPKEF